MENKWICKYGTIIKNGLSICLMCSKSNDVCCFVRYCTDIQSLKMTKLYDGCKYLNDEVI